MGKKVLVTGGMGYIGSHTVVELLSRNYNVLIADNLSTSRIEILDGIESITGRKPHLTVMDLCNPEKTDELLSKNRDLIAVIHFAAFKAVSESVINPLKYYHNNLVSLMNLIDGMKKYGIHHFVFSSSCTVYGEPDELPVTEKSPVKPALSPYGNTKQISEEILKDAANTIEGFRCISLRYFNPIGAHPSALIGELPAGIPDNLLPIITQTAAGIRQELKVFGNDYNTPDGSCIRDYLDVNDLARSHVSAIERMYSAKSRTNYEVFNLGTGKGVSVFEMIRNFENIAGIKINHSVTNRRPGDVEKVWADPTLANQELGWKAETSLDKTLISAWNWEKKLRSRNK